MLGQLTIDFSDIMQQASDGKSLTELMERLDAQLTYGGAKRISESEAELLDQLDESYEAQIKMQTDLEDAQKNEKRTQETVKILDNAISQYCSETTRNKILLARGWQFMPEKEEEIKNAQSDGEEIGLLKRENNSLKTENIDLKERIAKIRTFITKRCSRIPILGRILIREMQKELGENQLTQPKAKEER